MSPAPSIIRIALASLILAPPLKFFLRLLYLWHGGALVIGPVFFPGADPSTQALNAFLTFAVAFLTRPLGAVFFGHFGDRIGRKYTLNHLLIGHGHFHHPNRFLPGYNTLGFVAPLLLCLLRVAQDIGLGGEWGGACLVGNRKRANWQTWLVRMFPQLGPPAGFYVPPAVSGC